MFYNFDLAERIANGQISHKGKQKLEENNKREDNINRSRATLRDTINSNAGFGKNKDCFLTLTYKENFDDVKKAKEHFKAFLKKWERRRKKILGENCERLKYVYVIEFQERGAIHFHCIFFDLEYTLIFENDKKNKRDKTLSELWGHGFIKINSLDNVDNVGAYLIKYMSKDLIDERLKNADLYGLSRENLNKPIIEKNPAIVQSLLSSCKNNIIYSNSFNNEYRGFVLYSQVNLKREINKKYAQKYKIEKETLKYLRKKKKKY